MLGGGQYRPNRARGSGLDSTTDVGRSAALVSRACGGQRVTFGRHPWGGAVGLVGQDRWTEPRARPGKTTQGQRAVGRVPRGGPPSGSFGPNPLVGSGGWFGTYHLGRGVRALQAWPVGGRVRSDVSTSY